MSDGDTVMPSPRTLGHRSEPPHASPRRTRQSDRARQKGQATLEAATGLTIFLLLLLGIVDFAPAVVRSAQLTQAVREGVAYARTAPTDTFGVRKRVVYSAPAVYGSMTDAQIGAMTTSQIAVTCTSGLTTTVKACSSAAVGDSVTITATYNHQLVTGILTRLLNGPLEITETATSEIF